MPAPRFPVSTFPLNPEFHTEPLIVALSRMLAELLDGEHVRNFREYPRSIREKAVQGLSGVEDPVLSYLPRENAEAE